MRPSDLYAYLSAACLIASAGAFLYSDATVTFLWFFAAGASGLMALALRGQGSGT